MVAEAQIPAPVFLAGRVGFYSAFGQTFASPCREILAKAARIDEVIADLGQVEAVRAEEEIDGIHGVEIPDWLVLYHVPSGPVRGKGRR
jgi:hypothetical protein